MKKRAMKRRTFLRGTIQGGVAIGIGLPLLEAMLSEHGTALAQDGSALTKRFGVFFFGNGRGVERDRWRPSGTGASWTPSVELAPLTELKDYISVVTGIPASQSASPQGHHHGSVSILSGYNLIEQDANNAPYRSTFKKPSIDQLVATAIGSTTRFRSLELATSGRVISGEGTTIEHISHNGPDSANPPEVDPRAVFDRLFAMPIDPPTNGGSPVAAALQALRGSVLDTVLGDLSSMQGRVGAADKIRLEQHAESIRAIERRLQMDPGVAAPMCSDPTAPADIPEDRSREPLAERLDAMGDLLALGLSCDLTRVFSLQWSASALGPVFWQVGSSRIHHDISHDGAGSQEEMEKITIFTMEQLAILLKKLRDTPDGTGNLLDSLALLATSDCSDGAAHTVDDYPIVIAGRAGGALVHPGVHYQGSRDEHTNSVLLTLLRSVGVDIPEIGEDISYQTMGLSALEA
jgi:hypothetical protein